MSSPSFRLLQLPQVVLRELLNLLDLNELFIFSLCSRRANRYVKVYFNRFSKWKMSVTGCISWPEVRFEKPNTTDTFVVIKKSSELQGTEKVTIGGHTVPFVKTPESCELLWDDERIGIKIVDYICELFSRVPSFLCVGPEFIWMLKLFSNLSEEVMVSPIQSKRPYAKWMPFSEEECLELLTAKIISPLFVWGGDFPEGFKYTGSFGVHEHFVIHEGLWITVENLVSIGKTCTDVFIRESKLTSTDINTFLKIWMNHKANALRSLVIKCENINQDVIFNGLEDKMITVEGTMVYENMGTPWEFPPGLTVLRRNDGMIAAAALLSIRLCIGIWTDIGSIRENDTGTWKLLPINNPPIP
uniref:F-box domain-containing protein n=1 Tax=Caenorhabditis tropicalis TaxID=1561998 RepID=A0A1I7UK31_9PELO